MPSFQFKTDAIPENWQFLNGLRKDDLIAELIQNELDAGSTLTKIIFYKDKMVCEGNGNPIDDDGWERLKYFRGAGEDAPRKRAKTGVKNHGLKACFTIGNDIFLRSAGKFTQQTLYDPAHRPQPYPGAMTAPEPDPDAPDKGCRIEVPYRTNDLHVTVGEPLTFSSFDASDVEALFRAACNDVPKRFLGVVRPGLRPTYTVELTHWKYGTYRCHFSAKANAKPSGSTFTRTCSVTDDSPSSPTIFREQACLIALPRKLAEAHEIPEFYQARTGFFAEVAWRIDARGKPMCEHGQLRYPIAYAGNYTSSSTGICASYSAPFISDTERHGISEQAEFNAEVIQRCDDAFVKVLRDQLIPRYGPAVLSLVCDSAIDTARRRKMLELILRHRVIPLAGKPRRGQRVRLLHKAAASADQWSFVIPSFSWDKARISQCLGSACPPKHHQLHADTPPTVVQDLAESVYGDRALSNNDNSRYTVFNECDVVALITGDASNNLDFPWNETWKRDFAAPQRIRLLLDVLLETETHDALEEADRVAICDAWSIPDDSGTPTSLSKLFSSRDIFDFPPNVDPPKLIHRELRNHPLFRRKQWKRKNYGLTELLDHVTLDEQPDSTRDQFWQWMKDNWRHLSPQARNRCAAFPIWPTVDGDRVALSQLCFPANREIREIVRDVIAVPAETIKQLSGVRMKGRGALAIRSKLSAEEVRLWFEARLKNFEVGKKLDAATRSSFEAFEVNISTLAKDPDIGSKLRQCHRMALALDQTGVVRACADLHRETDANRLLTLCPEDLIDRRSSTLDKLFPPRIEPDIGALRRALRHPPKTISAWMHRLAVYVKVAERANKTPVITDTACVLVHGDWRIPTDLTFQKRKGSYWGRWKVAIPVKDRSAEEQEILRKVGVCPSDPTPASARAFFEWLQADQSRVSEHISQIIRHFGHKHGVTTWWVDYPSIACIPVFTGTAAQIVSLSAASKHDSRVYIDDFPALADAIRASGASLAFVQDRVGDLSTSIVECLSKFPVKRLSHVASDPVSVKVADGSDGDERLYEALNFLRSRRVSKEMRSRFAQWDIPFNLLHDDWTARLASIRHVSLCGSISAIFRVDNRDYEIEVASQYEPRSHTLYVVASETSGITALCDAVSNHIFKIDAPKMAKAAFERAVRTDLPKATLSLFDDVADDEPSDDDGGADVPDDIVGEAQITHSSRSRSDLNLPRPQVLAHSDQAEVNQSESPNGKILHANGQTRPSSKQEEQHIQQLKQIYAWHCQICLATKSPQELAPEGSYVFLQENRRHLIKAHHPDQFHAGGARHGGNLLVVCEAHHQEIGDRIPRSRISEALRSKSDEREVSFTSGAGTDSRLSGVVVEVPISTTGTSLSFFFDNEHRDYWLKRESVT